jgi:hypothetical protein
MDLSLETLINQRTVLSVLGGGVAWWFATASRRPPRRTHDGIVLEMPLRTASILSAVFIFGVYVWLWSSVMGLGTRLLPMWLFIALAGGYFVKRTVVVRHELHARGIRYATRFNGARDILWFEIVDIDHSGWSDALEIRLRDGSKASISTRMIGFGQLARTLLDNAPTHAEIDPRTRALLTESAVGDSLA